MLIGLQPLGIGPLGGALGSSAAREPVVVVRGQAFNWRGRVMVGGVDVTELLTGPIDVDREEGAAGVAGFALYLPPGPVVPDDWRGQSVTIDYISRDRFGELTEARLFTGRLEMPEWDPTWRVLACECSDQLQQRVEALATDAIDGLTGGVWTADLFEPTTGRSHWEYALERLESRPASLDLSATGALRVTPWAAQAVPHYVYGTGTTLHESVQVDLQPLGSAVNRLEIDAGYRFARLWELSQSFSWTHPAAGASISGFCSWRVWSSDLPTTEMIADAVTGAGLQMVGRVGGYRLPLTAPNPCGDGNPWLNEFDNLWLVAAATGARRWTQTVTENYKLVLVAPGGSEEVTQVIERDGGSVELQDPRADEWEQAAPEGETGATDLSDEQRRSLALQTLLRGGQRRLLSAHRGTTLSWQTPTDLALGVDLTHTVRLEDKALGQGKCRRIQHQLDLEAGTAITTLSVAISRGGGEGDALLTPARPNTSMAPPSAAAATLGTQLGGRLTNPVTGITVPPYDDDRLGFAGNWDAMDDLAAETFPRRFKVQSVEVSEAHRNERVGEVSATYRVAIPNDLLEV